MALLSHILAFTNSHKSKKALNDEFVIKEYGVRRPDRKCKWKNKILKNKNKKIMIRRWRSEEKNLKNNLNMQAGKCCKIHFPTF